MEKVDLQPDQTALVLIEYQNEWVSERGNLRNKLVQDKEAFAGAIEKSKDVLTASREKGYLIIHVTLQPDNNYLIFGNASYGMRHAIPANKTWQGFQGEIHPDFKPENGEHVITGRTGASAFSGSNLDSVLRNNRIHNLILIGFATHVCVESTLRAAHDLGYNTFVITEATGAFSNAQKKHFSQHIVRHFGKELSVQNLLEPTASQ
ncbi:cysteine hydrolase family protein [Vibrio salinus]|uniref:cysteine hydrolase family protein n=1 Tax=Vibrio salinus TaxID=2899784 RepID=UPI001E5A6DDA|nr:cysteine hydrolase [Vibrio salinus]MCE0496106.1 cysteine hydrolase [Vibrio salinus]